MESGIQTLESGIHSDGIRNPGLPWIPLHGAICGLVANFFRKLHFQSPCYLYCHARFLLKLRARFRFLGYIRRLGKKNKTMIIIIKNENKNKKPREKSRHFTNGLMA